MAAQIEPMPYYRIVTGQLTIRANHVKLQTQDAPKCDITVDGQRFLTARPAQDRVSGVRAPRLIVVQNWID
ncbi:MAG: hypothetical protein PVI01_12305 [Gemmatimonadales bacterium]|jgi:hypothetical protein